MRIFVAVLGMLVMFLTGVFVLFFGILGFTPTRSCSGACTAPLMMSLIGPVFIGLFAIFATWFRAVRAPRAYWPWIGAVLIFGVYLVALSLAERVL